MTLETGIMVYGKRLRDNEVNEDQDGLGNLVTAVRVGHKDEDLAPTATIVVLPNIEDLPS